MSNKITPLPTNVKSQFLDWALNHKSMTWDAISKFVELEFSWQIFVWIEFLQWLGISIVATDTKYITFVSKQLTGDSDVDKLLGILTAKNKDLYILDIQTNNNGLYLNLFNAIKSAIKDAENIKI
jgi:hypothetical protein